MSNEVKKTAKKSTRKSFAKSGAPDPMIDEMAEDVAEAEARNAEATAVVSGDSVPEDMSGPPAMSLMDSSDDVQGDVGDTAIRMPRLNIVQKVGPLADTFNKGEFVLNLEEKIADNGSALEVTVVKAMFYFEENLPYGEDRIPERAMSRAEVHERGGILDWVDDQRPSWHQVAEVLLAIKCPKGLEDNPAFSFVYEGEDKDPANGQYTFALFKLKGASFNSAGREILTAKQFYYREGLTQGSFLLTAPLKQFRTGNSAFVATLRKNRAHSADFRDWLRDFAG